MCILNTIIFKYKKTMRQRRTENRKDDIHTFGYTGQSSKPNEVLNSLVPATKNHVYFS